MTVHPSSRLPLGVVCSRTPISDSRHSVAVNRIRPRLTTCRAFTSWRSREAQDALRSPVPTPIAPPPAKRFS
jgi:hypothetical protein